jgi:hypothetical protein
MPDCWLEVSISIGCAVVSRLVCTVVVVLSVLVSSSVCIAVFTLDAGLLARSQYPEGPTTGLDTDFSWFPWV